MTANNLVITAGSGGIGTAANPLRTAVATLAATATSADINLIEADSLTIASGGLDAGSATIQLEGGTFTLVNKLETLLKGMR